MPFVLRTSYFVLKTFVGIMPIAVNQATFLRTLFKQLILRLRPPVLQPLEFIQTHGRRLFIFHGPDGAGDTTAEDDLIELFFDEIDIHYVTLGLINAGVGAVFVLDEVDTFGIAGSPDGIKGSLSEPSIHPDRFYLIINAGIRFVYEETVLKNLYP